MNKKLSNRKIIKLIKRISTKFDIKVGRGLSMQASLYLIIHARLMLMHPDGHYFPDSKQVWEGIIGSARGTYKFYQKRR